MSDPSERLEELLSTLKGHLEKPVSELIPAYEETILLSIRLGRTDEAKVLLDEYSTLFSNPVPVEIVYFCDFQTGVLLWRSGEIDLAEIHFKKCALLAEQNNAQHSLARVHVALAILCFETGRHSESLHLIEKAEAGLRSGPGSILARALNWLGIISVSLEQYQQAWSAYSEALEITEELSLNHDKGYVLSNMGLLCQQMGLYKQAEGCFRDSMRIQEEVGDNYGLADSMANLGILYFRKKHLCKEAEIFLGKAGKMHVANNAFSKAGLVLVNQALALVHLGDFKKAEELFEQAYEYLFPGDSWYEQVEYCGAKAEMLLESGNLKDAEELIMQGMEIEEANSCNGGHSELASIYSRILHEKGDFEEAFRQLQNSFSEERKLDKVKTSAMESVIYSLVETAQAKKALHEAEEEARTLEEKNASLKLSEQRFRSLVNNMTNIGVIAVDQSGAVTFWNETCTSLYGYKEDEVYGKKLQDLIIPEHLREWFSTFIHSGVKDCEFEVNLKALDGSFRNVLISLVPFRQDETFIIQVDFTSQRRAEDQRSLIEAQMRRTQKLEALGTLAGGIAHDFNNLLQGILGNAALLCESLESETSDLSKAERIKSAAERSAELCTQMLDYAGVKPVNHELMDINHVIGDISILIETSLPKNVCLLMDLSNRVPHVIGDKSQIRQVIMNLVLNGAESIQGTGEVEITTDYVFRKREDFKDNLLEESPSDGDYLLLKVRDNGSGIDPETLTRIFDPFFSTKMTGRGLGLAAVLGIIRGHSGAIMVESLPGTGTEFSVYLEVAPDENLPEETDTVLSTIEEYSGKRILVVDDEEIVRETIGAILLTLGFEVTVASGGAEALSLVKKGEVPDLMVLDLTMPGLNGSDVFKRLQCMGMEFPVIVVSGYSEDRLSSLFPAQGPVGFLQKPFSPESLKRMLIQAFSTSSKIK